MMKSTMKRMVLTGAAVAVMMGFAAPAMALPNVVDGGPGVIGPVVDPPPPPPPPNPLCDVTPFGCGNNPDPVLEPGDNPVAGPPPEDTPPPDNIDPRNEESDTGESGGSSGGNSGGGPIGSASETIDRGGTFVSSFLPTTLTSTIGDVGNFYEEESPRSCGQEPAQYRRRVVLPCTGRSWTDRRRLPDKDHGEAHDQR